MKRFDFSKRHNICAICFVIVMVLTGVLCLTMPVVHAEENTGQLASYYTVNEVYSKTTGKEYTATTYPNYNYTNQFFEAGPFSDNCMDYADDILDVFKSDYDFQADLGNISLGSVSLYFFTLSGSDELRFCFNNTCLVRGNWTKTPPEYYETQFTQSSSYKIYKVVDGVVSYDGTLANTSSMRSLPVTKIVTATGPIYIHGTQNDVNYLTAQGKCGNTSGGCGIARSYANEDASNNLYLQESDFIFTHQTYYAPYSSSINTGSAVPVGTITFKGQPNDFQIEHSNDFYVQLYFMFDYDVEYKNQTGNDIMDFKKTSSILNNEKALYYCFTTPTTGPTYKLPLSTFIERGNTYSVAISDVFDDLVSSNGRTLTGVLQQSKEVTEISYNTFKLTCNAFIVGNGLASQGKYTEWYNFNSKKGFTTDTSLNDNPNPYTPNPTTQSDDDPDSTNIQPTPNVPGPGGSDNTNPSTTTTSTGGTNIIITNNPTFNNGGGSSGGYGPTTYSESSVSPLDFMKLFNPVKFFTNLLIDKNKATAEDLAEDTGVNGWFEVVNSTYSFIPEDFWTILKGCFVAFIGITIIAFIIRIILDLL